MKFTRLRRKTVSLTAIADRVEELESATENCGEKTKEQMDASTDLAVAALVAIVDTKLNAANEIAATAKSALGDVEENLGAMINDQFVTFEESLNEKINTVADQTDGCCKKTDNLVQKVAEIAEARVIKLR